MCVVDGCEIAAVGATLNASTYDGRCGHGCREAARRVLAGTDRRRRRQAEGSTLPHQTRSGGVGSRTEGNLRRGQWVNPNDKTTVVEYARQWAAARPYRPSTARNVNSLINNHIAGTHLGSRRLVSLRPSEVQAWATERSKLMSPLRLRNTLGLLKAMYRDAVLRPLGWHVAVRADLDPVLRKDRWFPSPSSRCRSW